MRKILKLVMAAIAFVAVNTVSTSVSAATLSEGFEANVKQSYDEGSYVGDACTWNMVDAGVWTDSANSYAGTRSMRFGNTTTSSATLASNKTGGCGTISFYGRAWTASDGSATVLVQYSLDSGSTWKNAGSVTLSATTYSKYSFTVNASGSVRVRFQQSAGKRLLIDNISITDYSASTTTTTASITSPTNGSTVDFGTTTASTSVTKSIVVKGTGLTSATSVAISGTGFSVNSTSLSATKANSTDGATLQVTFKSTSAGSYTGYLSLTNGSKTVKVTLKAIIASSTSTTTSAISSPTNGSTVDFGSTELSTTKTMTVVVKGSGLTSATSVAVSGTGFTAGSTSLSASKVNSDTGAQLQVNFKSATARSYTGTLTLTNGSTTIKVNLKATAASSSSSGSSSSTSSAVFSSPASGSTIDFGTCTASKTTTNTVVVKGTGFTESTTVTVTGTGFTAGATTLSATKVNSDAGAQLQINFKSASAGSYTGTLKLVSGSVTRQVSLTAKVSSSSSSSTDDSSSDSGSSSGDSGSSSGGSTGSGVTGGNIPSGYYSTAVGKCGQALLTALYNKITSHTAVSYANLWTAFKDTDTKSNGKIWDVYSTKEFTYSTNQCGSYSKIGDCYNREHSFPKSWFSDATPMYTDLFHIYPTDGYVNNQRANYPFGECSSGTYVASSGTVKPLGKLGKSTYSGYTGTVWEPDDEYKGDFARAYFYMVTAYNNKVSGWSSDMLAGNAYPAFSSWAQSMLLKWNALDPVSQKEVDRNEAVYAKQKNRNPFIDHPELADYIWGSLKTTNWSESAAAATAISSPADGSSVSFGTVATNSTNTKTIAVQGVSLSDDISVSVDGEGFSASAELITNSAASKRAAGPLRVDASTVANADAYIQLTFHGDISANYEGELVLTSGSAVSHVRLTSEALDGLPAAPAENVSDTSFTARWVNVGDEFADGTYRLDVADDNGTIAGYPVYVDAGELTYLVENLQPDTHYTFSLTSETMQSNVVEVTTDPAHPAITYVFDPEALVFSAAPGQPSASTEVLYEVENVTGNVTFSVTAPFEVSTDNSDWATSVTAAADASLYVRLGSTTAGEYISSIRVTAGEFFNDLLTAEGQVYQDANFVEDFETTTTENYTTADYTGSACAWTLNNAGTYKPTTATNGAINDDPYEGNYCLRFGKDATSSITMASDKVDGAKTLSFFAHKWADTDATVVINIDYSIDGGQSWTTAGVAQVTSTTWEEFSADINVNCPVRFRLAQTAGARVNIDYITATVGTSSVADINFADCKVTPIRGGVSVEAQQPQDVKIYGIDGIVYVNTTVSGSQTFALPKGGVYLIAVGKTMQRVVIR
ncbi:MAG: endonuclease [Candidatus Limisoma sp.]